MMTFAIVNKEGLEDDVIKVIDIISKWAKEHTCKVKIYFSEGVNAKIR